MNHISVNIARFCDSYLHDRLRLIWDAWAEYNQRIVRLHWFDNSKGMSVQHALEQMWEAEQKRPAQYAVLLDENFLPNYNAFEFCPTHEFTANAPVLGVNHYTRHPQLRERTMEFYPGAWFLAVSKSRYKGPLDFSPLKQNPDAPASGLASFLHEQQVGMRLVKGQDATDQFTGSIYPMGWRFEFGHLLSHYWNTPINRWLFVGDVARGIEQAIVEWLLHAPQLLKDTVAARAPFDWRHDDRACPRELLAAYQQEPVAAAVSSDVADSAESNHDAGDAGAESTD